MAEEIIKEDNPEEEDTQKGKYMTFKSGHEYFGIETGILMKLSVCRVLRQFRR